MLFPRVFRRPALGRLALLGLGALGLNACAVVQLPVAVVKTGVQAVGSVASAGARAVSPTKDPNAKPDAVATAATTAASSRDRPFTERVNRPDLTMAYLPADRKFTSASSVADGRTVPLKPFLSGRSDPAFRAAPGLGEYRTAPAGGLDRAAAMRSDLLSTQRTLSGTDRTVATRAIASRDAPGTARALPGGDRADATADKRFAVRGKRQDALDRQNAGKPLSVDDVRALLNKGPRPPETLEAPRP